MNINIKLNDFKPMLQISKKLKIELVISSKKQNHIPTSEIFLSKLENNIKAVVEWLSGLETLWG